MIEKLSFGRSYIVGRLFVGNPTFGVPFHEKDAIQCNCTRRDIVK